MNWGQGVILAVVEGVTEFLPVSSTGHMILVGQLLGVAQTGFVKSFEIAIQLGAIGAIVALYWRKLLQQSRVATRVAMAFLPTGIIGVLAYKLVKQYLLGNAWVTVGALFLGGVVLLIWEGDRLKKQKSNSKFEIQNLSYGRCVLIGLGQAVAMIPGVSRALATILSGEIAGLGRKEAVEFSFLLAVPTMMAATGWDLVKSGGSFGRGEWEMLGLGFGAAFTAARVTVKWLVLYVKKNNLAGFGWYRIGLAVGWWLLFA
ncbi:hypothetical protein A2W16_03600 [Candidatus Amesbacteria bacterium RBG_16_48_31]|nr:MAG: hypothetical protein A2W16_03600 [Candidatus Amesbacteria bacterium RBG_16_48_31]